MRQDQIRAGRLAGERSDAITEYLSSMPADRWIGRADVLVDIAHLLMLQRQGVVAGTAAVPLLRLLLRLYEEGLPAEVFDPRYEDVHAGIEAYLIEHAGADAGGRLQIGRSRNDEVAACIRLRLREEIIALMKDLLALRETILSLAGRHIETVMPGFTHLQVAQPTTLAHHLLAYEQAFSRDFERLRDAYGRVNRSPLGAAAFASTGYAIDRAFAAECLGFSGIIENSMDAVSTRDFALETLSALAVLMTNASRLAEELILWSSPLIGFVELADPYCSSSSIMPQKKNPDTAEILRGKTATVVGDLTAALALVKALPMSYNRDLQELTPRLWEGVGVVRASIPLLAGMLGTARFDAARMEAAAGSGFSTATELADRLVREFDLPFRTAHTIVGRAVRGGRLNLAEVEKAAADVAGISLAGRGLTEERIREALDVRSVVAARKAPGGPAPAAVSSALAGRHELLAADRRHLEGLGEQSSRAVEGMLEAARRLVA
ncbi:MAG: argininosuccinate lyase [Methanomicrobiales archaeon]|nr:argininosuccinate lyase [Methanomicrobiales archaeon]MDI6875689.1 argininosuccinate lyase [Methanomicrobiales archaeon]